MNLISHEKIASRPAQPALRNALPPRASFAVPAGRLFRFPSGFSARRAFSLVELMIVVIILGLLAGIATYAYSHQLDKARRQKAKTDISIFKGALDLYYGENGRFPETLQGLKMLVDVKLISAPLPNDPWGRPYQYVQPGRTAPYDIICYGADGREGGTGADADITSNDVEAARPPGK